VNCPNCEAVHQPDDNFCAKCGVRLRVVAAAGESEAPCRNCGAITPSESRYCGHCGIESPHALVIAALRSVDGAEPAAKASPSARTVPPVESTPEAKAKPEPGVPKPVSPRVPSKPIARAPAPKKPDMPSRPTGESAGPSPATRAMKTASSTTGTTPVVSGSTTATTRTVPAADEPKPSDTVPGKSNRAPRPKVLAAPEGWPDLTDELAEIRFLVMQGFEDEAKANLAELQRRHPGHPDLPRDGNDPATLPKSSNGSPASRAPASPRTITAPSPTTPAAPEDGAAAANASPAANTSVPANTSPSANDSPAAAGVSARAPLTTTAPQTVTPTSTPPVRTTTAPPLGRGVPRPTPAKGRTAPPIEALEPTSPLGPSAARSPADSAADTLEVDLEDDIDPAALSIAGGQRSTIAPIDDDDERHDETRVDLEFEHLDRTVVAQAPAAPPSAAWDAPPRGETQVGPPPSAPEPTPEPTLGEDDDDEDAQTIVLPPIEETSEGTVIARAPSAPAPYRGAQKPDDPESAATIEMRPASMPRTTVIPDSGPDQPPAPAPFGGAPPPGSTLVPGTAPTRSSTSSAVTQPPRTPSPSKPAPPSPAAAPSPPAAPSPAAAPSAPATPIPAAAPSAKAPTTSPPPVPGKRAPVRTETVEAVPQQGTVIAPPPSKPAAAPAVTGRTVPPGAGPNEELAPVRFVMLGTQGEPIAEQLVAPGGSFDIGRMRNEPWNDDEFIEPQHARLVPMRGGVRVDELTPRGAVFRRLRERTPLQDGDQLRVGQSLLVYERAAEEPGAGPWGRVIAHAHPDGIATAIPLGEAGLMVGREIGEVTLPQDTFVSSTHCRVVCNDGGVFVEDLDSSNGTYLRLRSGQWVPFDEFLLIGQTQFAVRK